MGRNIRGGSLYRDSLEIKNKKEDFLRAVA
jgi:hypothetical protein